MRTALKKGFVTTYSNVLIGYHNIKVMYKKRKIQEWRRDGGQGGVNDVAFLRRVFQSASKRTLGSNAKEWGKFVRPVVKGRRCAAFCL